MQMDQQTLESALQGLGLGGVRYYPRVGSTNDEAARWALEGAPDMALVAADEQTAGRGRLGRRWLTPAGAALAFSLVLYPGQAIPTTLPRLTALGALAVCTALEEHYHLAAQIKWPNDVLVARRKVAGVLVEAQWQGAELGAVVLGIGINVATQAVSAAPTLDYPASTLETELGAAPDRLELLRQVLSASRHWRECVARPEFLQAWEAHLAFRNEWVQVWPGNLTAGQAATPWYEGQICGLAADGALQLYTATGAVVSVEAGEIKLRPKE